MKKRVLSFSLIFIILIGYILSPLESIIPSMLPIIKANADNSWSYSGNAKLTKVFSTNTAHGDCKVDPYPADWTRLFTGGTIRFDGDLGTYLTNNIGTNSITSGTKIPNGYNTTTSSINNTTFTVTTALQCASPNDANPQINQECKYLAKCNQSISYEGDDKITKTTITMLTNKKNMGYLHNNNYNNGYQHLMIAFTIQKREKRNFYGYITVNKQWTANGAVIAAGNNQTDKTFAENHNNLAKLVKDDRFKDAYPTNKYTFKMYDSASGGNLLATWTQEKLTLNTTNKDYSKINNSIKIRLGNSSSSTKNVWIEETLQIKGWAKNTGRQKFTISNNKTVEVTGKKLGQVNTNIPIIVNIHNYKVYNAAYSGNTDEKRVKVTGGTFKMYYSPLLSEPDDLKKYLDITWGDTAHTTIKVNLTEANKKKYKIIVIATGTLSSDGSGWVDWTPNVAVNGWDFIGTDQKTNTKYAHNFRGPVGAYGIIETKAPDGFVLPQDSKTHNYNGGRFNSYWNAKKSYDATTSFIYHDNSYKNNDDDPRWKIWDNKTFEIKVKKTFNDSKNFLTMLPDLYKKDTAKYNLYYDGTDKSNLVANITTDTNGNGEFTLTDYAKNTLKLKVSSDKKTIQNISHSLKNSWYLKETYASTGFGMRSISRQLQIDTSKKTTIFLGDDITSLYEPYISGRIYLTKKIGTDINAIKNGKANGAKFYLFYSPGTTNVFNNTNINTTIDSSVYSTHINGNIYYYNKRSNIPTTNRDDLKNKNIYVVGSFEIKNNRVVATAITSTINNKKLSPSIGTDTNNNNYFYNLPLGTYCLIEVQTPYYNLNKKISFSSTTFNTAILKYDHKGYATAADMDYYTLTRNFTENNSKIYHTYKLTYNIEELETNYTRLTLNKEAEDYDLISTSVNSNTYSVEGAIYNVYYRQSGYPQLNSNVTTNNNSRTYTIIPDTGTVLAAQFKVNSNGRGIVQNLRSSSTLNFSKIPGNGGTNNSVLYGLDGYYTIIEVKRPNNYDWDKTIHKYYLTKNGTAVANITSIEPIPKDPFLFTITKAINSNIIQTDKMTEEDILKIRPLKNTKFELNFYNGAQTMNDIKDKDPSLTIKYQTKSNDNGKTWIVNLSKQEYMIEKPDNLNDYIVDDRLMFPVGIYTITEIEAAEGYNLSNKNWIYNGSTYNELVCKVVQDTNNASSAYTYIKNGSNWSIIPSLSVGTGINFTKPNNIDVGTFKFNKKLVDKNNESNFKNVKFKLFAIHEDYISTISHFGVYSNSLFISKDTNDNIINDWNWASYRSMINNGIINPTDPIEIITNSNGNSMIYSNKTNTYINSEKINLPVGSYLLVEICDNTNKDCILDKPKIIEITKNACNTKYYDEPIINYSPYLDTLEYSVNSQDQDENQDSTNVNHMVNSNTLYISDKVSYNYLKPNKQYTLKSIIMYIDDNNNVNPLKINNNIIQVNTVFNTNNSNILGVNAVNGDIIINFDSISIENIINQIKSNNAHKFVIYEFLFNGAITNNISENELNKLIAGIPDNNPIRNAVISNNKYLGHYSSTDINQIGYVPEVSTYAINDTTRLKTAKVLYDETGSYITINDTLTYKGFKSNTKYYIELKVKNADDNSILNEYEYEFTTDDSNNGTYTINNIKVNITDDLDTVYITENIYDYNNNLIVSHEELTDAEKFNQSVSIAKLSTKLITNTMQKIEDPEHPGQQMDLVVNNIRIANATDSVTLTDTIYYKNLTNIDNNGNPIKYTIQCDYVYVDGGKRGHLVKDNNGNSLSTKISNVKLNGTGSFNVKIPNRNLSNLLGKTIVAYETIKRADTEEIIIEERELSIFDQMIKFEGTKITITKVDNLGRFIPGCKLEIRKNTLDGDLVESWTTALDNNNNPIEKEFILSDGDYYLIETESKPGYTLADPIKFNVNGSKLTVNGVSNLSGMIIMVDNIITRLPTAGGMGTITFTIIGLSVMCIPVIMISRKKKRKF